MAQIHAFLQLDPDRAPEQAAFVRSRTTVLRESGGQFWVALEEAQVATLLSQGIQVSPVADADLLAIGPVVFRPASETPAPPSALRAPVPSGEATGFWLVHFVAPADKSWLQAVALAGGEQVQSVDAQSGVFRMTSDAAESVRALASVDAVGIFHPAYAVGLDLTGAEEPLTATTLAQLAVHLPPPDGSGNLMVRTFDGVDPAEVRPGLEAAGATVVAEIPHGYLLGVPLAAADAVLAVPGVFAASLPAVPNLKNHNAGVILGVNQVRDVGTVNFLVNLDGLGEIGAIIDSGFDVGSLAGGTPPGTGVPTPFHPDLAASIRMLRDSATPQNAALTVPDDAPHGTHVAGTVAGDGTSSGGATRGMAPRAAIIGLAPIPNDFRVPFDFAAANGARVLNNSWGADFAPPSVNNNRYLPGNALAVDRWCFDNPEVLVLFAASNAERDTFEGPNGDGVLDGRSLSLEPVAKNVFTIGASENLRNDGGWRDSYRARFAGRYNNPAFNVAAGAPPGAFNMADNADHVAMFSDRGVVRTSTAATTRRVKPDVVAPGTLILSTRSQWVAQPPALPPPPPPPPPGSPPLPPLPLYIADPFYAANVTSMLPPGINRNLYQILNGTSMATPMVTGSALLVRQYFRTRYAQQRRPLLLEGVALPAAPPLPAFATRPAVARHNDGLVFAWITPALPAGQKNIVAMRVGRHGQAPLDAAPVHLQDDVGDHAAPAVVTVGERTYLLHRHKDGKMRLSCYDRALRPVAGFGTAGVVTLAPGARTDDTSAPTILATADSLACLFPVAGGTAYFFQRIRADTGAAIDPAAISFLLADAVGQHRPLAWDGHKFTACAVLQPGNYQLQVRQIYVAGAVTLGAVATLADQAKEIRGPCIVWDPRIASYALIWCDARNAAGGEIWMQFLDAAAAPTGAAHLVMAPPAGARVRRLSILLHPNTGYVLAWEDDSQNGHFDLYVALVDAAGVVDGRIAADAGDAAGRRLLRISDTPSDIQGFAVLADTDGAVIAYHSPDEVNSDRLGVYAVNLTASGAFEAQEDPATPFLRSGRYVTVPLLDHNSTALSALSAVWTGGAYYLLRLAPAIGLQDNVQWLRLTADGAVDTSFGVNGVRERPTTMLVMTCEMLWTGNDRLISATNDAIGGITLHLDDAQGMPVATFGVGGAAALQDTIAVDEHTPPQIGFVMTPALQIVVGYGVRAVGGPLRLRQQRVDATGVRVGNATTLGEVDGVATHGWFQFVNSEARSIAIYHRVAGAVTQVHCRRFRSDGTADGAERDLSSAAGEATNGVLARRPTAVDSTNREYGAAWQYRANNASRWQIRFSRLDRQGKPIPNPPVPAPPMPVRDLVVIDGTTPGWPATFDAVEPQFVSTYTHEPWANAPTPLPAGTRLPEWSPAYGLAWIGVDPSGSRELYFTVLDENGRQIAVTPPPPPAGPLAPAVPVGFVQVSAAGTRVQEFKLVWNGRIFLLNWVEEENGNLHHRATMINRHANQVANDLPSAALLRATIVNGATNITPGPLPDTAAGYGWGRVNLRQSLSPAPPVTLHVRDDCAIGPGRTVVYRFVLPAGTALLRVTLNWTDPPGPAIVNRLHLTVRAPAPPGPGAAPDFRGNLWNTAAGQTHLSRPVATPPVAADAHEDDQTFKQVVLANPVAGTYQIEVSAAAFPADPFNQQNLQPFALVFAGTGPEVVFAQPVAAVTAAAVY